MSENLRLLAPEVLLDQFFDAAVALARLDRFPDPADFKDGDSIEGIKARFAALRAKVLHRCQHRPFHN